MCLWLQIVSVIGGLLFGGGVMRWLLAKPKVHIEPIRSCWYYTYDSYENKLSGSQIMVSVRLENDGNEQTRISGVFETTKEYPDFKTTIFHINNSLDLEGHGTVIRTDLWFSLPLIKGVPPEGETLNGILKIKPWGNRRLLIFGKRYLVYRLAVPYSKFPPLIMAF